MSISFLPSDDLPPVDLGASDQFLNRKLEEAVSKTFYETCNGVTQGLLLQCQWSIQMATEALKLDISCPDMLTNWRVLNNVVLLGNELRRFSDKARIRISPPPGTGTPFEIRVDEISIYRDML